MGLANSFYLFHPLMSKTNCERVSKQLEKFKGNICKLQKNKKSCSSLNYCDLKSTSLLSSKKECVKKQTGGRVNNINKKINMYVYISDFRKNGSFYFRNKLRVYLL
mgnify:CR=1 FL=1